MWSVLVWVSDDAASVPILPEPPAVGSDKFSASVPAGVFWIAAIRDSRSRLKPDGSAPQYFRDAPTLHERDCAREPGAVQNPGNLGIDRGGESEDIDFFGAQQRAFRDTVHLRGAGASVKGGAPPG